MRWTWIDQIIAYEADRRLVAIKNVSWAEEYLHDHLPASGSAPPVAVMPASLLVEGMAQTAGILAMIVNGFREKVILAKIVRARFDEDVFPGHAVRFDARLDRIDEMGAATSGTLERLVHPRMTWEPLGNVDLMFSHVDRNLAGRRFPPGNFVFTDHVRTILAASGLAWVLPDRDEKKKAPTGEANQYGADPGVR